jgi:hypothetical protein
MTRIFVSEGSLKDTGGDVVLARGRELVETECERGIVDRPDILQNPTLPCVDQGLVIK